MDSDDELPDDEEEFLVYVEFEGLVGGDTFTNENLQLDMIGIDTEHPIMQVNGRFYEGTYEHAIGTYMFFEKDNNCTVNDPLFETPPTVKYSHKTRKLLKMQRIFVKERTEVLGDSEHQSCIPNMDTIKNAGVPAAYQEEGLAFWEKIREERMEALSEYLQKQKLRDEKKSQGILPDSESEDDNPFALYKYIDNENAEKSVEGVDASKNKTNVSNIGLSSEIDKHSKKGINLSGSSKQFEELFLKRELIIHDESLPGTSRNAPLKTKKTKNRVNVNKMNQEVKETTRISDNSDTMIDTVQMEPEEPESILPELQPTSPFEDENPLESVDNEASLINDSESIDTSSDMVDKRLQKILKREEKMKEISNRMKIGANEYIKIKTEQ